jgi:DNA-binding transcriptional regulator YdaS (Cro superfamily)
MKLSELTPKQRAKLATLVPTSADVLRHIATGARQPSATMASAIERAAKKMKLEIQREALCTACGACELARLARKKGKS